MNLQGSCRCTSQACRECRGPAGIIIASTNSAAVACSAAAECCSRNRPNPLMLHQQRQCTSSSCTVIMHLLHVYVSSVTMVTLPLRSELLRLVMTLVKRLVRISCNCCQPRPVTAKSHCTEFAQPIICWPQTAVQGVLPEAEACWLIGSCPSRMQSGKLSSRLKSGGNTCSISAWHADLLCKGVHPAGASACPPLASTTPQT